MTTVLRRHANRPATGGAAARRAVTRWAWRLFRREWRQQLLVVILLTFTMAVAVFGITATYNVVPTRDAEFGTANHRFRVATEDPSSRSEQLASLEAWFGSVELIGHQQVRVPGSLDEIELRAQATDGPYSQPMLQLREGRYPVGPQEVAVTDGIGDLFRFEVGSSTTLGTRERTVVGIVENPGDLDDEFALVPNSMMETADAVTVLVDSTPERALKLPASVDVGPVEPRPACHAALLCLSSGQSEQATAAAGALGFTTILFLLVALVAAASFVVLAQRRLRQLGMLAANGATERHLRLVVVINGALAGAIAAVAGTVLALSAWLGLAPLLEEAAGRRIDRFHLPVGLIVGGMILVTLTATAAAWWPARLIARVSVMAALSSRPPRPKPARRSLATAAGLVVGGVLALATGIDSVSDQVNPFLLIGGVVALVVGLIVLAPIVVGKLGAIGGHLPVGPRIALRDLARYRARSGAALAAITLALAIPIAVVVIASAAKHAADEGNLSPHQLLFRLGDGEPLVPDRTPQELDRLHDAVDGFAANLPGANVVRLDVAINPADREGSGGEVLRPAVVLGRELGDNTIRDLGVLYVATPALAELIDLPPDAIKSNADALTSHTTGDLAFANVSNREANPVIASIDVPAYTSAPTSLIPRASVTRHGWVSVAAGWLIESTDLITSEQQAAARATAAAAGMTLEIRDEQTGLSALSSAATATGFLVALGILALTIGLIRSEARAELPILTAAGATSTIRRKIGATTAGAMAAAGGMLGAFGAYAGLSAGHADDLQSLGRVPLVHLSVVLIGLPITAALSGWLLAGAEPPTLGGSPIE